MTKTKKQKSKRRKAREIWIEWSHLSERIMNYKWCPLFKIVSPCGEIIKFREVLPKRRSK